MYYEKIRFFFDLLWFFFFNFTLRILGLKFFLFLSLVNCMGKIFHVCKYMYFICIESKA